MDSLLTQMERRGFSQNSSPGSSNSSVSLESDHDGNGSI